MAKYENTPQQPGETYKIHVKGMLTNQWTEWFDGMQIGSDGQGNTIISGLVIDQAALHGLLERVRDLGLTLLSVTKID
jgi:hypothetical protein